MTADNTVSVALDRDEYYPVVVVKRDPAKRERHYDIDPDLLRRYLDAYAKFDRLNGEVLDVMNKAEGR